MIVPQKSTVKTFVYFDDSPEFLQGNACDNRGASIPRKPTAPNLQTVFVDGEWFEWSLNVNSS